MVTGNDRDVVPLKKIAPYHSSRTPRDSYRYACAPNSARYSLRQTMSPRPVHSASCVWSGLASFDFHSSHQRQAVSGVLYMNQTTGPWSIWTMSPTWSVWTGPWSSLHLQSYPSISHSGMKAQTQSVQRGSQLQHHPPLPPPYYPLPPPVIMGVGPGPCRQLSWWEYHAAAMDYGIRGRPKWPLNDKLEVVNYCLKW